MIAVIADDFTGAAELAGISLRFGLKVQLYLQEFKDNGAEVAIVCTDSRSMKLKEALEATRLAIQNLQSNKPGFIYKKIDSVLRGYVLEEIQLQQELTGMKKAFLQPANPTLQRTISNGEYFINEMRITETGFVQDPEFPITSSSVKAILGSDNVTLVKCKDELPVQGTAIGEATSYEDLVCWANELDQSWLLAGAGDFYTALLERSLKQQATATTPMQYPWLYVCGTALAERKKFIRQLYSEKNCVAYMPDVVTEEWIKNAADKLFEKKVLVVAIDESAENAMSLRSKMAIVVRKLVTRSKIKELFIEGGSTAAAILKEFQINQLQPVEELSRGVVRMRVNDLSITVKPGSYKLPLVIKDALQD